MTDGPTQIEASSPDKECSDSWDKVSVYQHNWFYVSTVSVFIQQHIYVGMRIAIQPAPSVSQVSKY